jgi:hypothetical protein
MDNLYAYEIVFGTVNNIKQEVKASTAGINATNVVAFGFHLEDWFTKRKENCLVLQTGAASRLDLLTPINYYVRIDCGGSFNPPRPAKFKEPNYVSVLNPIFLRDQSLKLMPKVREFPLSLVDVYQLQLPGSLEYLAVYRYR